MKRGAEIVIIGGGCMGASLAWHLARRGLTDVVLVEREAAVGSGSTGRNAGGVRHQFSSEANVRLSIESIRMLEHFEEIVGWPADFHQHGYLFLVSTPEALVEFRRNVALQRGLGVDVRLLAPHEARELAPGVDTAGVIGATFCGKDGIADPNGVTLGFIRGAQAAGVEVARDTEVIGIRSVHGRVTGVETTRGPIDAAVVVNAAGPWAGEIGRLAGVAVPVSPLRRHIFIAQPPTPGAWDNPHDSVSAAARHASEHRTTGVSAPHDNRQASTVAVPRSRIMVIDFETSFYFHREGAGVLFGMGDPDETWGFDLTVRWDFLPQVIEVAVKRLPALADAAVSHAWAGLYEMTPDHNPIIGASRELQGFYVLAGFSGHGFQHSPAAGRILADVIVGRDPAFDLTPFALERFGAQPEGEQYFV